MSNDRENLVQEIRSRQSAAKHDALKQMQSHGLRNVVRVTEIEEERSAVTGYLTRLEGLLGSSPPEIVRVLGLRPGSLKKGANIYRLNRFPMLHEFEVRGFTTLPGGLPLEEGKSVDDGGYPAGTGVIQWVLTAPIDASLLKTLGPLDRFSLLDDAGVRALSGANWWHANQARFPNSSSVQDLEPDFRFKVEAFLGALGAANANVLIAATRRNAVRAYLMHWCFKLANGKVRAVDVPGHAECNINWVHPTDAMSRAAAKDMVDLFDIVYQPSLTSLHIKGLAIDMNISWAGTMKIVDAKGVTREIGAPRSGAANDTLHKVGASYGVRKLLSDKPHWSSTGH